jgi:hypothetical protein
MKPCRFLPLLTLPLGLAACGDSGGSSDSNTPTPDAFVDPDAEVTPAQDSQVIGGDAEPSPEFDAGPTADAGEADAAPEPPPGPFRVRGTLEQVYIWQAPPETPLELVAPDGSVADTGVTDTQGSLVFRQVDPGQGYIVRVAAEPTTHVEDIWVRSTEDLGPDPALYEQPLQPGYGYLTTRDGTKLSIFVTMPGPARERALPDRGHLFRLQPISPRACLERRRPGVLRRLPDSV